jgi:cytochrome o ubiquinol oxidase subunit 1
MYTVGLPVQTQLYFMFATMLIAIPTGVKTFNWLFTMYRGRIRFTSPMYWALGFIVTFAIGGSAGVLLASPPADYVLHNSLFLVAHFHNVLIPGSLFGFMAGYCYWFPKATGFRLKESWGKRAFWCWLIGFYLAFVPLYVLGFMGMPRRLAYYANPAWHPPLLVAALGTAVIGLGIVFLGIQLLVSLKERQALSDHTGDPWDGRTLEWAMSSPPAVYNFARLPVVNDIDAFTEMKEKGIAYQKPDRYHDIHLPKNMAAGFVNGVLAFLFGFAMVWYIWWLAILCALGMLVTVIARAADDDTGYVMPAAEVERIENRRYQQLASTAMNRPAGGQTAPELLPQV